MVLSELRELSTTGRRFPLVSFCDDSSPAQFAPCQAYIGQALGCKHNDYSYWLSQTGLPIDLGEKHKWEGHVHISKRSALL